MAAVIATNDDATSCKLSCVQKGYWKDPFIHFFTKEQAKRPPLINRGYYSRVAIINALLREFLVSGTKEEHKQLIILGAGFDTTFFQLSKHNRITPVDKEAGYNRLDVFECDFHEVVSKKISIIQKNAELRAAVHQDWDNHVTIDNRGLRSDNYHILPVDLHNLDQLDNILKDSNINKRLPTMILSECVLIYLKPEYSDKIIEWASNGFINSCFATYEQIRPDDPFGSVMMDNLNSRGCPLLGARRYPSLISQVDRYKKYGYNHSEAMDMFDIYNNILDNIDKYRIQKIELFDEYEEWKLIQEHYCIVWSWNDQNYWKRSLSTLGKSLPAEDETESKK